MFNKSLIIFWKDYRAGRLSSDFFLKCRHCMYYENPCNASEEPFARPRSGLFVYQKEGESRSIHDSLYWSPLMDNSDPCQDLIDCSINTSKEKNEK